MIRSFFVYLLTAVVLYSPAVAGDLPRTGPINLKHATPGAYRVAQMIPFPGGARTRSILPVVSLGSGTTSTGGVTSVSMTTITDIPVGAQPFVAIQAVRCAGTFSVTSVSDGTNSYTLLKALGWQASSCLSVELWTTSANAVSAGATITANFSTTVNVGSHVATIAAAYVPGALGTYPSTDKSNVAESATTTPSSGSTGTLTQANELVIGAVGSYAGSLPSLSSEASGFTSVVTRSGGVDLVHIGYQIVSSTSSLSYQPTLSANTAAQSMIVTLKGL